MSFTYRGTSSDEMKFNVTERQVYNAPAFDVNAIEVPGRSGDVLNSQNRFKNKQITYTGFLRASDFPGDTKRERLSRGLRNLKAWICGDAGKYHDLTDDYDPGFIRRAFVSGETAITEIFDRPDGVTITITFYAEPFMYEDSEPIELPETQSVGPSPIASFSDGADNAPLKSLIFSIEPQQDLHGFDYPWPAGGGKNLLAPGVGHTYNGITTTVNSDGSYTLSGTATGTGGYLVGAIIPLSRELVSGDKFVFGVTNNVPSNLRLFLFEDTTQLGSLTINTGSNSIVSTVTATKITGVRPYLFTTAGQSVNITLYPQIEIGTSATSFAPYSNICPISGTSQVDGKQSGEDMTDYTPITIDLGRTVYGGTVDVIGGELVAKPYYASYSGQALVGPWISSHDKYAAGATPTTGAQVVDMGAAGTDYDLTPVTGLTSLLGQNNIWHSAGETQCEYVVPTENPTAWPSRPRLEITMSGAGTLTVNGKTWSIGAYTGTLICDSEIMDWYDPTALRNNLITGTGFPELVPGENLISYTGGITKVVAIPRWRTL